MRHYQILDEQGELRSLPSVTTILEATMTPERRSQLELARVRNPANFQRSMAEARARGNYVHRYISAFFMGGCMGMGQYAVYLRKLQPLLTQIREASVPHGTLVDQLVYSQRHRYAGTFDLLCRWPKVGMTLVDFKTTGHAIWPAAVEDAKLQVAAYREALESMPYTCSVDAIAVVFLQPHKVTPMILQGEDMEGYCRAWLRRRAQYPAALAAMADA